MIVNRIAEHLPLYMSSISEISAVMSTEQTELDELGNSSDVLVDNAFVGTANEEAILRYEKLLDILPNETATLDERKFDILVKSNEQLPYTLENLRQKLSIFCGEDYSLQVVHGSYSIKVALALSKANELTSVVSMLADVLPCNMLYAVSVIFNTYGFFGSMTHSQLTAYSHKQLREHVFE